MKIFTLVKLIILGSAFQLFAASVTNVTIESACANSVKIRWIGSATKEFNIYRATQPSGEKIFLGSVNDSIKGAVDLTAQPNQKYYYYVEGIDIDLSSDMSTDTAMASIPAIPGKPLQPSAMLIISGIIVSWTYINPDGGIHVYRSTNGGDYNFAANITNPSALSWIDNTVLSGNSYSYKICGYNDCIEGEASLASPVITITSLSKIADLVIDSFSIAVRGDTLSGEFVIKNIGNDSVLLPFDIDLHCNGSIVDHWHIDKKIPCNSYFVLPFEFRTKDTSNNITIYSDCEDVIDEISEENNILTSNVHISSIAAAAESEHLHPNKSTIFIITENSLLINSRGIFQLNLIDLSGRCILDEKGYGNRTINLKSIGKGSYLAVLKFNNKTFIKQLIRN